MYFKKQKKKKKTRNNLIMSRTLFSAIRNTAGSTKKKCNFLKRLLLFEENQAVYDTIITYKKHTYTSFNTYVKNTSVHFQS